MTHKLLAAGAILALARLAHPSPASTSLAPFPARARPGFALLSPSQTGLGFTNLLSQRDLMLNANLMNGSGVALGDYDGDGWCDIYFCGLNNDNRLFRNLGGWKFQDVTDQAGVRCDGQSATGAVFADLNGDGHLDLLVTSMGGPNACFINQGNGRFADATSASGLSSRLGGMSMTLADVDGNGTLDLYLCNYGATSILRSGGALNISYVNGKPMVRGRYAQRIKIVDGLMHELGEPDVLYLNNGRGGFKPQSWTSGVFLDEAGQPLREAPWDQGLSAMFYDLNGDRAPDLYVCNDAFTPDRFYLNDGRGIFRAVSHRDWRVTSHFSMGVDFGDLNRDGLPDFMVVDMLSRDPRYLLTQRGNMPPQPRAPGQLEFQFQARRNTLYENRGGTAFAEVANFAGLSASEWSWSCVFLDVDLDGWEDILVSNGFPYNMDDLDTKEKVRALGQLGVEASRQTLLLYPPLLTPNVAFRNLGGMRFEESGALWGFNATNVSNGFACADLDNDGDLDLAVNCLNAPALLYRNDSPAPRLAVRLKGLAPNTQGIGANITVTGGPVPQSQQVISGGRYISGDDPLRVFACGSATNQLRIEVLWRNGARTLVENAKPNHLYVLDEKDATTHEPARERERPRELFTDASTQLNHTHHESAFNDFDLQPGLPNRLSRPGPALATLDFDRNGAPDLLIGSGAGQPLALLRHASGAFTPLSHSIPFPEDITALAAHALSSNETEIIAGLNALEAAPAETLRLLSLSSSGQLHARTNRLDCKTAIGALALAQIDGAPWLFAGGHFERGRYPEPAPSFLYTRSSGAWQKKSTLTNFGSITAALWQDLDGDDKPELIAASDWGPIRVLAFDQGRLTDRTRDWGLEKTVGRWLSLAMGDFNNDGRPDLAAGNWGQNSFYSQFHPNGPVLLYYADFTDSGRIDCFEAFRDPATGKVFPWRDLDTLSTFMPWLRPRFPTHARFAEAGVASLLQAGGKNPRVIETDTLASTIFLNLGSRFEARPLPAPAQSTPVSGLAVADFTGDQIDDLFLAQNFFAVRDHDAPLEGGRGLLLAGKGHGDFSTLTSAASGLNLPGEQRACLAIDFNGDGRPDLVATQNGAETKLLENSLPP